MSEIDEWFHVSMLALCSRLYLEVDSGVMIRKVGMHPGVGWLIDQELDLYVQQQSVTQYQPFSVEAPEISLWQPC